ncbi:hypothetical protein H5410_001498 [Solanum commersonii]|uniref:Bet v I/Major latex protein domain-containing protein n=1 Tax=Solanum commersonii TaxID=4109 RepID=A0A9J6AYX5_SOLCO|nr:hypothetical protein H5410_001498 [Solanum commersonii]
MGVKGKLIASMEVTCGGHSIHDLWHTNTHQLAKISPTINRFEVHEGEIGNVGTVLNMTYNDDGQEKTVKYEIEAIDRYKKSISRKVIDGDLLEFYNNPEPLNFLGFILNATKDIEDGKEKSVQYEIEAIDRCKKSISRKVIGGDLLDFYSFFTFVSSCEQQWITWTFEYEKKIEDNPEPLNFLGFILNATKDIEGHFIKK